MKITVTNNDGDILLEYTPDIRITHVTNQEDVTDVIHALSSSIGLMVTSVPNRLHEEAGVPFIDINLTGQADAAKIKIDGVVVPFAPADQNPDK